MEHVSDISSEMVAIVNQIIENVDTIDQDSSIHKILKDIVGFAKSSKTKMREISLGKNGAEAYMQEIKICARAIQAYYFQLDLGNAQQFLELFQKFTDLNMALCRAFNSFEIGTEENRESMFASANSLKKCVDATRALPTKSSYVTFLLAFCKRLWDHAFNLWELVSHALRFGSVLASIALNRLEYRALALIPPFLVAAFEFYEKYGARLSWNLSRIYLDLQRGLRTQRNA